MKGGFARYLTPLLTRDTKRLVLKLLTREERVLVMMAHGMPLIEVAFDWHLAVHCARHGYVPLLDWAQQVFGASLDTLIYESAASSGSLNVLEYLKAKNGRLTGAVSLCAAGHGHLHILKWLYASGARFTRFECIRAALGGHLKVLQWLREIGTAWDEKTCENAAWNGHLEVLKWAIDNGCPLSEWIWIRATQGGHLHVLKALNLEGDTAMSHMVAHMVAVEAIHSGHVHICQWLLEIGIAFIRDMFMRSSLPLAIQKWARENGFLPKKKLKVK
jgi:hypothetical protein